MLTDELLAEARRLYYDEVQSLRSVARELLQRTGYASAGSLLEGLRAQFRAQDWPIRGRVAETVRVSTTHGLASRGHRDPAHRRRLKVARGDIRDVRCAGVKQNYPGKGARCRSAAQKGGEYCRGHDPALDAVRRAELERARAMLVEVPRPRGEG